MIYIFAFFSSVMMIAFIFGLVLYVRRGNGLGYLNIYIGLACYISLLFLPLFYGSVGSFFNWPSALEYYSDSWMAFAIGIPLLPAFFILAYKVHMR